MSGYDVAQLSRLEPPYLHRYGLTAAPFPPTHEDQFLYLDAERQQRLNMLQHLTEYSNLLLIVTGERGVGKTSLKQRFIANVDKDWQICQVDAHTMMDASELLTSVAKGFGMTDVPATSDELLDSLYNFLSGQHKNERMPILVVDDAHELPQDALEALFHLADVEGSDGNLLRTILFCEPEIEVMLESPAISSLRERITHSMEIPPFDEEHTTEYLHHRLIVAGLEGASPFTAKDIKRIYKTSHGVPERINEAAHLILNGERDDHYQDDEEEATKSFLHIKRIAVGVIALSIIGAVLIFQDKINQLLEDPVPQSEEVVKKSAAPPPQKTTPAVASIEEKTSALKPEPSPRPQTKESPGESAAPATESVSPAVTPAQDKEIAATATNELAQPQNIIQRPKAPEPEPVTAPQITTITPNPVKGSRQRQILTLHGTGFTVDADVTVTWTDQSKKLSPAQIQVENDSVIKLHINVGTTPDTWSVVINDPEKGRSNTANFSVTPPEPVMTTTGLQQAPWILKQKPQHFTLQLLASHHESSIKQFVKQHRLKKDVAYFQQQRNGKPWYALIYGRHATRPQAEQAVQQLPPSMRRIKPWIRDYASIHKLIREAGTHKRTSTTPLSSKLIEQESWIWSQDPRHFTLQLLGGRNSADIRRFIKQHQLAGKVVYFRTMREGKPWYALIYGSYPEQLQAQQAIQQLPPALRKTRPWARSFSNIHADLHKK